MQVYKRMGNNLFVLNASELFELADRGEFASPQFYTNEEAEQIVKEFKDLDPKGDYFCE